MKIIPNNTQNEPTMVLDACEFVAVGDTIFCQAPTNCSNAYDLAPTLELTVTKVNTKTFVAKDNNGNQYRLDVRSDNFRIASKENQFKSEDSQNEFTNAINPLKKVLEVLRNTTSMDDLISSRPVDEQTAIKELQHVCKDVLAHYEYFKKDFDPIRVLKFT